MVAHIVLISLGYAGSDHLGLVDEVWNLVTTYPGMLLATAGTPVHRGWICRGVLALAAPGGAWVPQGACLRWLRPSAS